MQDIIKDFISVSTEIDKRTAAFKESIKSLTNKYDEITDALLKQTQTSFDLIIDTYCKYTGNPRYPRCGSCPRSLDRKFGITCQSEEDALGMASTLDSISEVTDEYITFNAHISWAYGGYDEGTITVPISFYNYDFSDRSIVEKFADEIKAEKKQKAREEKLKQIEELKKELEEE